MGWPLGVICWPCTPDFQAPNSSKGHASPHTLYPLGLILNPGGGASGEGLPSGTQESRKSPVMVHKLSALKKRPRPQSESWDASLKHTLEQPSPPKCWASQFSATPLGGGDGWYRGVEVRGAHSSKIATSGAASYGMVHTIKEI
jgi:hypothetical protein